MIRTALLAAAVAVVGLTAAVPATVPRAQAAHGSFILPFDAGQTFYVCQGYQSDFTHNGVFALDLTAGSTCSTDASTGKTVRAPFAGTVVNWVAARGELCIKSNDGFAIRLTHINRSQAWASGDSIASDQVVGSIASPTDPVGNNGIAHLHIELWAANACFVGSTVPFDTADSAALSGISLPDLGTRNVSGGQYKGTALTRPNPPTPTPTPTPAPNPAVAGDYNGDGITDIAVWRPSTGEWYIPVLGGVPIQLGQLGDVPVPGYWTNDAVTDIAVWRPSTGIWYIHGGPTTQLGQSGDVPVPGDYTGDGITDIAVWRPSTGVWYIHGGPTTQLGQSGDVPVPGDYTGDGITDIAVWRPSTGQWFIYGGPTIQLGQSGDVPVPGDYTGDGITDIAVWRPSTGQWFIYGGPTIQLGQPGDVPVPGSYANPAITDIAVWRPSTGVWFIYGGPTPQWGIPGDVALNGLLDHGAGCRHGVLTACTPTATATPTSTDAPTDTPTATPTHAALSVGGVAEQPDVTALPSAAASSGRNYTMYILGVAGAVLAALCAGAWATWRRRRIS